MFWFSFVLHAKPIWDSAALLDSPSPFFFITVHWGVPLATHNVTQEPD